MSEERKTIDDIVRTKIAMAGDERVPARDDSGDFKITFENFAASFQSAFVGQEIKTFNIYKAISASFPWLCLSLPSVTLTSTNYGSEFITEMRSRKLIYDEMDTAVVSFSGSWSGTTFTLDDNAANVAMITALSEDYLLAGTFTAFRILYDGTAEFEISGITAASREIVVSAGSPSGTSISIYLYRVYGSTTSVRHHSEAGLAVYQSDSNKINGMRRLDQVQGFRFYSGVGRNVGDAIGVYGATTTGVPGSASTKLQNMAGVPGEQYLTSLPVADGTNGTPRTGLVTEPRNRLIKVWKRTA